MPFRYRLQKALEGIDNQLKELDKPSEEKPAEQ